MARSKPVVIASRRFLYKGKQARIDLLSPVKEGAHCRCLFRVTGIPFERSLVGAAEETPFAAIYNAYYRLVGATARLGNDLVWEKAAERGQTGLPICALTAHGVTNRTVKRLQQMVDDLLE